MTVPAEMAATVRLAVDAGDHASTSEVVREASRDWTRQNDAERRELETLREAIRVGLASGPGVPAGNVESHQRPLGNRPRESGFTIVGIWQELQTLMPEKA